MISPGTELTLLDTAPRGILWRARHRPDGKLGRVWRRARNEGLRRAWSVARGNEEPAGEAPMVLGYSCAGIVREVGEDIDDLAPGTRVACVGPGLASHAEVVAVPRNLVATVPASVSLRDAASIALGGIALQALHRSDARLGHTVAVVGLGVVGQLLVQVLASAGCRVLAVDPRADRIERAAAYAEKGWSLSAHDASTLVAEYAGSNGVDSVIVATGKLPGVVQSAACMVRPQGRLVVVGLADLSLERSPAWSKELDVVVSRSYGAGWNDPTYESGLDYPVGYVRWTIQRNLDEYLRQLAAGRMNAAMLIDREFAIDQAGDAYAVLREPASPVGVVLRYPFAERAGT